jgi:replicative DNA helicase
MHREKEVDPTKDNIICNVAKNRNGEVRATKLTFTKPTGRFSSQEPEPSLHQKNPF